ncbi:hypothetical protein B0H16DRAFT_385027 [Mycena metata]|uniref:Uncharacterized protein n=1 Tax=Mycena metata TaxID=1033252 RepID=A0AAD7JJV7_9AGAR|nr:hypothetical protein B0H16DRAFT_385027 [Mycena metata]
MHLSLRVERFSESDFSASDRVSLLPSRFGNIILEMQTLAISAVNGSLPDFHAVIRRVEESRDEMRFLPVFYHHLDPAKMPSGAEMDILTLPETTSATIDRAFLCFQGLFHLRPPAGSHADLWKRVWPWTQFFDAHHSRIPGGHTEDVVRACCFICVVRLTDHGSPTTRLILNARSWNFGGAGLGHILPRSQSHDRTNPPQYLPTSARFLGVPGG